MNFYIFRANFCIAFVLVANFVNISDAYKLLLVFPFPSKSHSILGEGFVRHLLKDGHEITYITTSPIRNPPSNLHQITVSATYDAFPAAVFTISNVVDKVDFENYFEVFKSMMNVSRTTLLHKDVQNLLQDTKQRFDAVIAEWMFSELYSGLSSVFGCPLIWSSSMDPHWQVVQLIDDPSNPSYTSDVQSANIVPFSFTERLQQLWVQLQVGYIRKFYIGSEEQVIYQQAYKKAAEKRGRNLKPYDEVRYNGSLLFGNSHASFGKALSLPESYKSIGGYHVDEEEKRLPKNLQEIMDNATHGVIYFSMGSLLQSKDMPQQMKTDFLNIFRTLKQTVIWKFEEELPNVPENLHLMKWAPQQSILAHPKTILFITHGGLLSTIEALHFGVPIIGMPAFADQNLNVLRASIQGYAIRVTLRHNMAEDFKAAIDDFLRNSKYREKTRELSMIYHDRLTTPGTELRHWVRHVVRTRGAPHLRSPALLVPFYQKYYLDLVVFTIILILIVNLIVKKMVTSILISWKNKNYDFKKQD